jgi:hypothetical protein
MLTRKVTLLIFLASSMSVVKYVLADVEPVDASGEEKAAGQLSPAEILAAKGKYYNPPNIYLVAPLKGHERSMRRGTYGEERQLFITKHCANCPNVQLGIEGRFAPPPDGRS